MAMSFLLLFKLVIYVALVAENVVTYNFTPPTQRAGNGTPREPSAPKNSSR